VIFQNGGYRHLVFLNFGNFIYRKGQESQTASVYTISCRSEKQMLRYGDFSIFQNGGRRHLGFLKFQNCNGQKVQEGQTAALCQISCRSVKPLHRYDDFLFLRGGRPILDFQILEILTVGKLKRAKLCQHAKFRRSRSNHAQNMAIFRFSKMAAAAIMDF